MIIFKDKQTPRLIHVDSNYLTRVSNLVTKNGPYIKAQLAMHKFEEKISKLDEKKLSNYHSQIIYQEIISSCQMQELKTSDKDNEHVIFNLINYANEIFKSNTQINFDVLDNIYSIMNKNQKRGYRIRGIVKVLNNNLLPSGQEIVTALNNMMDIYLGNNEYRDIDKLVRYGFQHLHFLLIRPYEFSNAICSRFLSLFFFKDQDSDTTNNMLFNISSVILKNQKEYKTLVQNSIIALDNESDLTEEIIKKSVAKDAKFINFFISQLELCLNNINNKVIDK